MKFQLLRNKNTGKLCFLLGRTANDVTEITTIPDLFAEKVTMSSLTEADKPLNDRHLLNVSEETHELVPVTLLTGDMDLSVAINALIVELRKDKSEGSYYYAWQANIAMAFLDEYRRQAEIGEEMDVHQIVNQAAKNFLDTLINTNKECPKP